MIKRANDININVIQRTFRSKPNNLLISVGLSVSPKDILFFKKGSMYGHGTYDKSETYDQEL